MLEFNEKMIITGVEQRVSQKTGDTYKIANFLGENGQTFGCMVEGNININGIEQLDKVDVKFKVIPGRYTQLKVLDMKKV